jgi:hypothetical protein
MPHAKLPTTPRWLVETFGLELLRSGGILEISAGKGKPLAMASVI